MRGERPLWRDKRGGGLGGWLLAVAWLLVALPALLFAAWLALPPAWRTTLGLPQPAMAPAPVVAVTLPALPGWTPEAAAPAVAEADAAWRRFRGPTVDSQAPLVAVVLGGLGRSAQVTAEALALPAPVGLALSPYGRPHDAVVAAARAAGHELLVELPMEGSAGDPLDLGPQALLPLLDAPQNLRRLAWLLDGAGPGARPEPAVGVLVIDGGGFLRAADVAAPVFAELARRGLLLLYAGAAEAAPLAADAGLVFLAADQGAADAAAVEAALAGAERIALLQGEALVVLRGDAATVARVAAWAATLPGRGFALAPPTQVVERRLAEQGSAE